METDTIVVIPAYVEPIYNNSAKTNPISPNHEPLAEIFSKISFFCQQIYKDIGMIKNPWEYSSELDQTFQSSLRTGENTNKTAPPKRE
jgi:hypothetical protein